MEGKSLFVIPARGGSKGIPGKNIKNLAGKPLLYYSIDFARNFTADDNICLSTDDETIIAKAREYRLNVPFKRPAELATDTAGTYDVLLHALKFYENSGKQYDKLVLLQPTSPFRQLKHFTEANSYFDESIDMVVTVSESKGNPYFNLFEEENGFLQKSKAGTYIRRQDCPPVYEYNGSIYIISTTSLKRNRLNEFSRIRKSIMEKEFSIDLDTEFDWQVAEVFAKQHGL